MIAIAGKYRSGKSFIINNLIGQPGCFVVGNETTACTQGLWIWNKAIPHQTKNGETINVIFIDTEGLGDTEKGPTNDVRIFMFAMLISSHLIYNCTTVIDAGMLD